MTVRGTVHFAGVPQGGVTVVGRGFSQGYITEVRTATTDDLGRYELTLSRCDTASVVLDRSLSPLTRYGRVLEPPGGGYGERELCARAERYDFDFDPDSVRVEGLASAWGRPTPGVEVRIDGAAGVSATVDADGRFGAVFEPFGEYIISVSNHAGVEFDSATLVRTLYPGPNQVEFLGRPEPRPLWSMVVAGGSQSCGLTESGDGYCWGYDWRGNLAGGLESRVGRPTWLPGEAMSVLDAGARGHVCGLSRDIGRCWDTRLETPWVVGSAALLGRGWSTLGLGFDSGCVVANNAEALCWGDLGLHSGGHAVTSGGALVPGGHAWSFVDMGVREGCGLTSAGDAYCWGGRTSASTHQAAVTELLTPQAVGGGHTWASLGVGYGHACGATVSGQAYCWGSSRTGQLGRGPASDTATVELGSPALVTGGHLWARVSAGGEGWVGEPHRGGHSCGVTVSGDAYCWGKGVDGRLGTGAPVAGAPEPVLVGGGLTWATISAGVAHTCGVTTDGEAYCWGRNGAGALGDGTKIDRLLPARVGYEPVSAQP